MNDEKEGDERTVSGRESRIRRGSRGEVVGAHVLLSKFHLGEKLKTFWRLQGAFMGARDDKAKHRGRDGSGIMKVDRVGTHRPPILTSFENNYETE